MKSVSDFSTVLVEPSTPGQNLFETIRRRIAPTTQDRELKELISAYRSLVHNRAITYPVYYQFVRELGHGRQGVVFHATRHCSRGCLTKHAIKLFDPSIYATAKKYWTDMGRVAKQVSLLQPINNMHLLAGDLYEECNGIGYIQMQAIDGVDLRFFLNPKQVELARSRSTPQEWARFAELLLRLENNTISLQPGLVVYILRNILRGIDALHETGFIHGDLKPTNIMVDAQGTLRLVDFGRAVKIGEEVNILLGSPLFMAPEIHRREPGMEQSDIFSIGMVALDLLQGNQLAPYSDMNENELLDFKFSLHQNLEKFLPAQVLRNQIFIEVLKKFLHPDASKRHSDAIEAASGDRSLLSARQWLDQDERAIEYERELEMYLSKLADPDTGAINPHFASDNLTAVIIT